MVYVCKNYGNHDACPNIMLFSIIFLDGNKMQLKILFSMEIFLSTHTQNIVVDIIVVLLQII